MPAATYGVVGRGPAVVLLHGVGVGPESFAGVRDELAADHEVLTVERPWSPLRPTPLDEQALSIVAALRHAGIDAAAVVGAGEGGTLALHLARYAPEVVTVVVAHEPGVGSHAPSLATRLAEVVRRVQADDGEVIECVRSLLGPASWDALPPASRVRIEAGAARARSELPIFIARTPDLAALRNTSVVTTVGATSAIERFEAARAIERVAGARLEVIAGAHHLVQQDAPVAFAEVIRQAVASAPVGRSI